MLAQSNFPISSRYDRLRDEIPDLPFDAAQASLERPEKSTDCRFVSRSADRCRANDS
ncbi:hypothetical protein QZM22_22015 [Burkholderia oklahomensis]|uniref:hypothetical protein n=1 Tax=Burkholderia oklahomensis TaxID=342113 RepID=UPI002653DECC|nr:hypothetical protein [Burkholderia oklahomensis]MDN7675122.1 hypothetical protein [Burkholderia oklahomensis]